MQPQAWRSRQRAMPSTDRRNQMFAQLQWTRSLVLAALALVAVAGKALAQTPEGTVITNTATATYTDANNNPYSAVSGSVSVTVGFKAGVDRKSTRLNSSH